MQMIECQHCGKPIKKYANRKYCLACRRIMDDIQWKAYAESHRQEIRDKQRERARAKRDSMKREE